MEPQEAGTVTNEWQNIETAPKDRAVLGWFPYYGSAAEGGQVFVMHWRDDEYATTPRPYFEASGWVWGVRDNRCPIHAPVAQDHELTDGQP